MSAPVLDLKPGISVPVFDPGDEVECDSRAERADPDGNGQRSRRRGSDQSDVDQQNFVGMRVGITPKLARMLEREAKKRNIARNVLVRRFIIDGLKVRA